MIFNKNLLNFTLGILIILSIISYRNLNSESSKFAKSFIEFKTDKNLKIELSRGKYSIYKTTKTDQNLDFEIIKSPNQQNTFIFTTSEKKESQNMKTKLRITTNDNVYEKIGWFYIQKKGKVLFDFKSLDKKNHHLAYQNENNDNIFEIGVFYYLMFFSIIISIIIAIAIFIKKVKMNNKGKTYN